jgi:hypothetical protein
MWLNLGRGKAGGRCDRGVVGLDRTDSAGFVMLVCGVSGKPLERVAVVGESPVRESTVHGMGLVPE